MNKETAQALYNTLMDSANKAYEKHQLIRYSLPVSLMWLGSAEAFEQAALIVNSAVGNILTTQLSERQKDINQGREEDAQAEAQYEMNETEE